MPPTAADLERKASNSNLRLRPLDARGIGVHGERIDPSAVPAITRIGAFVIRHASVAADVQFWREAANLLPAESTIQLVAYCDGEDCARTIRDEFDLPEFPVIAFGEVVASQAVMNADLAGAFVIIRHGQDQPGGSRARTDAVRWRDQVLSPVQVVESLLR